MTALPLETTNFVLRPLTERDATQQYLAWLEDSEVTRYLEVRHGVKTIDNIRTYIKSHDGKTGFLLGIFTKVHEHIGNFSLRIDLPNGVGTLGVMIGDRGYWGRDVIQETRAAVLNWAFGELNLHKVCGACLAKNVPAVYNYRRQGWMHEGTRREQAAGVGGERIDVVMFGMLASDWLLRSGSENPT